MRTRSTGSEIIQQAFSTAAELPFPTTISHIPYGKAPSAMAEELRKLSGVLPIHQLNVCLGQASNRALRKQFSEKKMHEKFPQIRTKLVTSETVKRIYEETPEPAVRTAGLKDLIPTQDASACRFYGRTVVFKRKEIEYALKFAKKADPAENLVEEWQAIYRMQALKTTLELQSDYPDVSDSAVTGVFNLSDNILPPDFERALAKEAAQGDFVLASMSEMQVLVYRYPENYHTYLHDIGLSPEDVVSTSDRALGDLARLGRNGLFHSALADLFHSPHEARRFRVNIDENNTETTWLPVKTGGTGRLANWMGAVETINVRGKTGLADPKHLQRSEALPLYSLYRLSPDDWHRRDETMAEEFRPAVLEHAEITELYEKSAEFKNVQHSIAERNALIEPLFAWSLSLIRSWRERVDAIRDGATNIQTFNLPETLRNGLVTFFSIYTKQNRTDVETAMPLADDNTKQPLVIAFDRLDAAIRLFTDGYAERYEMQPHAIMRKRIVARLKTNEVPQSLPEPSVAKRQEFIDLANKALERDIEPLFDDFTQGFENLGAILHSYPQAECKNICNIMNRLTRDTAVSAKSPADIASHWYQSYCVAISPTCDAPFDTPRERNNKNKLIAAVKKQTGVDSFDEFMQIVLQDDALEQGSSLKDEHIPTFATQKKLKEALTIFCRTFTGMQDGAIFNMVERLSLEYSAHCQHDRETLLTSFSADILAIRNHVHRAATAETLLWTLQIDFDKLKRDINSEDPPAGRLAFQKTLQNSADLTDFTLQSVKMFLQQYSKIPTDPERTKVATEVVNQLEPCPGESQTATAAGMINGLFDIDLAGNPLGRSVFPKELWAYDKQSYVENDGVPDIMDPVPGDISRFDYFTGDTIPRGYVRWKGNMGDKRRQDFGATSGPFPLTELSVGLIRLIAAAQMVRTEQPEKSYFQNLVKQGRGKVSELFSRENMENRTNTNLKEHNN